MKKTYFLLPLLLYGCTTTESIDLSIALMAEKVLISDQMVTTTGPTKTISGFDCKREMFDAQPSANLALIKLKGEAAKFGFNAVHSVAIKNNGSSLIANCWSEIEARGIAYNAK